MIKYLVIVFLLFLAGCKSNINKGNQNLNDEVSNQTDSLNALIGQLKQELGLNELAFLGEIRTMCNKWYIVEGQTKDDTYQDIGIYLYPLKKDLIPDTIIKSRYSYPGKEYAFDENLIYESEVFFGKCIEEYENCVIWYQRELIGEKWDTIFFIIHFKNVIPEFSYLNKNEIDINEILKNVQAGTCKEIPGKDYYNEP